MAIRLHALATLVLVDLRFPSLFERTHDASILRQLI